MILKQPTKSCFSVSVSTLASTLHLSNPPGGDVDWATC
uniref:Uncharacterized protein n=1 Tax=Manihot esculenta TaxID=3983 RepID=A0A2C9ULW2_MANES